MNSKKLTVAVLLGIVVIAFLVGMNTFQRRVQNTQAEKVTQQADRLVRFHSPIFGPANAPVTIVEFFDPACETCRAFYPMVKNLMKQYPNDVRLVLRYAPFHQGSDQVVKLLEAAKRQMADDMRSAMRPIEGQAARFVSGPFAGHVVTVESIAGTVAQFDLMGKRVAADLRGMERLA